ncbi:hypothetical protein EJ06DRAFT_41551 [Trichodelitschia bisporula]|uniref:Uncharacterized protein n=1 Tax=Trichodelitschia bisporula TaxID=703511 RepID=A0A6G1HVN0_9PEZI|nr:hypothetical protein EJ06DRAFT_41551 [Trichodelitschia bisporula]
MPACDLRSGWLSPRSAAHRESVEAVGVVILGPSRIYVRSLPTVVILHRVRVAIRDVLESRIAPRRPLPSSRRSSGARAPDPASRPPACADWLRARTPHLTKVMTTPPPARGIYRMLAGSNIEMKISHPFQISAHCPSSTGITIVLASMKVESCTGRRGWSKIRPASAPRCLAPHYTRRRSRPAPESSGTTAPRAPGTSPPP